MKRFGRIMKAGLSGALAGLLLAGCATISDAETLDQVAEKNGEVMVLFTSDVHCGIDQGFASADE